MQVLELVKKNIGGIFLIAFLILVENIAWIIEPTLFGNLIDAFIAKASNNTSWKSLAHILPLLLWIGAYLLNSGSGTLRRSLEPKIFQKIYVYIVTHILLIAKRQNLDVSTAAARAQLSQEYVTFMQYRMPEIAEQTISIAGAIFALTFFDYRISLTCLLISIPLLILSNVYSKHVSVLQTELHDNYENVYNVMATSEIEQVKNVFSKNAQIQTKIARWGSMNFGIMRLVLLGIFLAVLFIAIDLDNFSTGNIYSIVSYLWTFVTSVEYIPELMESRTSLLDLSHRLKSDG